MATVYKKKGSRFWHCSFRDGKNIQISRSTKKTNHREALNLAVGLERIARENVKKSISTAQVRKVVTDLLSSTGQLPDTYSVEKWFQFWLSNKSSSRAQGTVTRYRGIWSDFQTFLGKRASEPLDGVSIEDIARFRDSLIAIGISADSANLVLKTLRSCFNAAVAHGHLLHNPANAVDTLPRGKKSRDKFSQSQIQALLKYADREWQGLILTGYYIGARLGTCVRLCFNDFDLTQKTVTYIPEKQLRSKEPQSVTVPVHPELLAYLESLTLATGHVFPNLALRPIGGKTGLSQTFRALMSKAGVTGSVRKAEGKGRQVFSLSFHSLRHTFNSDLANASISQEIRRKLIGHASDAVNDIYTHVELDTLRQAINTLSPLGSETSTNPNENI